MLICFIFFFVILIDIIGYFLEVRLVFFNCLKKVILLFLLRLLKIILLLGKVCLILVIIGVIFVFFKGK